jgi:hypothetical protein
MPTTDAVKRAALERAACPVLETDRDLLAERGLKDARKFKVDVREIDPAEPWGRMAKWRNSDPERLFMLAVAIAVIDDNGELPEWVTNLAGGLTALQPNTRVPRMRGATA